MQPKSQQSGDQTVQTLIYQTLVFVQLLETTKSIKQRVEWTSRYR